MVLPVLSSSAAAVIPIGVYVYDGYQCIYELDLLLAHGDVRLPRHRLLCLPRRLCQCFGHGSRFQLLLLVFFVNFDLIFMVSMVKCAGAGLLRRLRVPTWFYDLRQQHSNTSTARH